MHIRHYLIFLILGIKNRIISTKSGINPGISRKNKNQIGPCDLQGGKGNLPSPQVVVFLVAPTFIANNVMYICCQVNVEYLSGVVGDLTIQNMVSLKVSSKQCRRHIW